MIEEFSHEYDNFFDEQRHVFPVETLALVDRSAQGSLPERIGPDRDRRHHAESGNHDSRLYGRHQNGNSAAALHHGFAEPVKLCRPRKGPRPLVGRRQLPHPHRVHRRTRGPHVHLAVAVVWFLAAVAVAAAPEQPTSEPWTSARGRDHVLAGRILDVAAGRFIEAPALIARLADRRFVLLGEKHDNADHRRLQAGILRALVASGRRPAVAFEMFDADEQAAIDRHLTAAPEDVDGLADAVNWKRSGWPDWALYRPIVETALAARLPIAAGNLARADLGSVRKGGLGALDTTRLGRLALDRPLSTDARAEMTDEIREAHCGHAPEGMVTRMIDLQRARDAQMADALLARGHIDGAVLIAGAGHARKDRGVPAYLDARGAGVSIASVAFLEVADRITEPGAYAARFARGGLPFDYVWFTARVDDVDPCEKFRKSLERLQGR